MRSVSPVTLLGLLLALAGSALGDDPKLEAIRKDRQTIAGTWRAIDLVVNGGRADEADARKITVVNAADGAWTLFSDGQQVWKGTSTLDPAETPKTIDFTVIDGDGQGNVYLGIYELEGTARRLCFSGPGEKRPTDFYSGPGSQHILVQFERVAEK
jgi:uncharacterized protein (TIGR03067 family)